MLKIADLKHEPEFHLDELLEVLAAVPDGFWTRRTDVRSFDGQNIRSDAGWEADAEGYAPQIIPAYQCGFAEEGDGKVMTVIAGRIKDTDGSLNLSTTRRVRIPAAGEAYLDTVFTATVTLGERMPIGCDEWENPRHGQVGLGESRHPGTAVLVAYLMAWGVVS